MAKCSDNDTFRRKIRMLDLIPDSAHRTGLQAAELHSMLQAEGFVIDRRGVERDLDQLSGMFPLQRSDGKPAGWSWMKRRKPPPLLGMDDETALVYSMLDRFLTPLLPPPLLDNLLPQFRDAKDKLKSSSRAPLTSWNRRIAVAPETQPLLTPTVAPQILRTVSRALLDSRQCAFDYRSIDARDRAEPKHHRVDPYGLVMRGRVLYLVAGFDGGDPYTFALHRIQAPTLLDSEAKIPADFAARDYAVDEHGLEIHRGASIPLELKVTAWWAGYFGECPLAPDQEIRDVRGSDEKLVSATVTDTDQLRWWLLSLGRNVEVRKPAKLRRSIATEVKAMARPYSR